MVNQGAWDLTDLQKRYERAQLLANDCTQDFTGNYFFPSDRSPKGYWTATRRQRLDYVCDCPDFSRIIDQQITNFAPSRWVRGDWSTNPDNRILVNRCLHCLAVAIAEREVDPNFPVNRIYQAKRGRSPKTDCGCGCGGSGDCGCPSKVLGIPEPRLIQGCETECYVEPLTPRTQRTPSTNEGIPAYQTFEIPTIEFAETRYQACFGDKVTLRLRRNTSQGFNNATVVGLPVDIEFSFSPESRTSVREVTLDFYGPGIYTVGIGAIAVGNFGDLLEAQIEILDCGEDLDNIDCPEDEFVDFGGGKCEGSYLVGFRQTGNKNPDGSCEILKVLKFEEGLDCPPPEDPPPKECESTIPRDCDPTRIGEPKCVNTGSGDGFNSNAGFNAVVRVQTGGKRTEYLRPDKKECAEYCEFSELAINVPSCPEPPAKKPPAPFCPIPVKRYIEWKTEADYLASPAVNGITTYDSFSCDDGTNYVLLGYAARCMPPANRYLDSFEAANYQGNKFGEGCCPFDETKPPRPVCPPSKWKCSNGVCTLDASGIYSSQAECEAALVPPSFIGGQCITNYKLVFEATIVVSENDPSIIGRVDTKFARGRGGQTNGFAGAIQSIDDPFMASPTWNFGFTDRLGSITGTTDFIIPTFPTGAPRYGQPRLVSVTRDDGQPDNCGSLPSTCPS